MAVTEVPSEVKKAFQNVLKEKQKLQPIPCAAVPMAVQKAVQDQQQAMAAPKKTPQKVICRHDYMEPI